MRSFEERAAELLHFEEVPPHWLAYEFLNSYTELGRAAEASLSVVESVAWLDEAGVRDLGRRAAYRQIWREIESETLAVLRERFEAKAGRT